MNVYVYKYNILLTSVSKPKQIHLSYAGNVYKYNNITKKIIRKNNNNKTVIVSISAVTANTMITCLRI